MNDLLWQDDHFVTQMNPDNTTRDLVVLAFAFFFSFFFCSRSVVCFKRLSIECITQDYDANVIAIAAGVTSIERSKAILKRMDQGNSLVKLTIYLFILFSYKLEVGESKYDILEYRTMHSRSSDIR